MATIELNDEELEAIFFAGTEFTTEAWTDEGEQDGLLWLGIMHKLFKARQDESAPVQLTQWAFSSPSFCEQVRIVEEFR